MSFKETFNIKGEQLLQKVKELVQEGNVTKIGIYDKNEKEIMSFPVSVGILGLVFAPIFAAVGALAALVTDCKIVVERKDNSKNDEDKNDQTNNTIRLLEEPKQ